MINVEFEYKQALRLASEAGRKIIPRLCSMALNKAARSVRTISTRESAKAMGIKPSAVRRVFGVTLSYPKMAVMEAQVWINQKKPLFLSGFLSVRQTASGVRVKAWGESKVYRGTFLVTMKSGHRGVFARKKIEGARVDRLPVHELYGPPVRYGFLHDRVQRSMQTTGRTVFMREFDRLLRLRSGSFRA